MNARRAHALMKAQFPVVDAALQDWTNILNEHDEVIEERLEQVVIAPFLSREIDRVIVEVQRAIGGLVLITELSQYLAVHIGKGRVQIADRAFLVFAVVEMNGVATNWRKQP